MCAHTTYKCISTHCTYFSKILNSHFSFQSVYKNVNIFVISLRAAVLQVQGVSGWSGYVSCCDSYGSKPLLIFELRRKFIAYYNLECTSTKSSHLEYGIQTSSKEAGWETLANLIVPYDGLIQTLCLQHIHNWSKCLFLYNTCIVRQPCHNGWLDKVARCLDHLQNEDNVVRQSLGCQLLHHSIWNLRLISSLWFDFIRIRGSTFSHSLGYADWWNKNKTLADKS